MRFSGSHLKREYLGKTMRDDERHFDFRGAFWLVFLMDSLESSVESTKTLEGSTWGESFIGLGEKRELEKKDVGSVVLLVSSISNVKMNSIGGKKVEKARYNPIEK